MTHKDDLLRAARVLEAAAAEATSARDGSPSVYALASRLREAADKCVMVPREPTRFMVSAGAKAWYGVKEQHSSSIAETVYHAMLAAAPGGEDGK